MKPMLYRRPTLQQLERDVVNFNEKGKEMENDWEAGLPAEYKPSLEEQIKAERDNMMQAIFPSERMRHASKIAKLENQLEDRKEYAKRLADCEEREEGI